MNNTDTPLVKTEPKFEIGDMVYVMYRRCAQTENERRLNKHNQAKISYRLWHSVKGWRYTVDWKDHQITVREFDIKKNWTDKYSRK